MPEYRSRTTTAGRNMAGARALWRATGMKDGDFQKPIIAVANSFTQFVPGHVHLKDMGQLVAREIEKAGGVAKEFNTIAVDDGIAMGHDGMLYSLPSRDLIADSVEYMVNAHCADALVCISNCDKITPGMLMAAMRLNIPVIFVSGGPMEAGKTKLLDHGLDLVDAMVIAADDSVDDETVAEIERSACPTCGSCSGMFTANSMNCLMEALGLALPGNGTVLATHSDRRRLFENAGHRIVELARRYYEGNEEHLLPRAIGSRAAFANAMTLDIAMGGSTNTILHLLAAAQEAGVDFTMSDIDKLSHSVPQMCKVAPNTQKYHIEDVHRFTALMQLTVAQLDVDGAVRDVDQDGVAMLDQTDGTARRRFRRRVADGQARGTAGKTTVGEQRTRLAQPLGLEIGRRVEHFLHARTALRPFVADDHDVAFLDLVGQDVFHRLILGLTDVGTAFEDQDGVIDTSGLHHATIQCDIAVQHGQAALGGEAMVVIADTALGAITIQARPARALREGGLGRDTARAGTIELDDFISG